MKKQVLSQNTSRPLLPKLFHQFRRTSHAFPLPLSQKGSALVMVMIFSIIAATLMVIAGRMISDSAKQAAKSETGGIEAENVARAGLVDAINWFIRKGMVKSGNPISNPPYQYIDDAFINSSNTVASDTMDPTIGIVNQYALESRKNLYARYEVRRQLNPSGTPTAVSVDPSAAHDVTGEMMMNTAHQDGEGLIWTLQSIGYIFLQLDATKAYNVAPNKVLASARISTVIRKMGLNMPAASAAIATNMSAIKAVSRGRIYGQGSFCASAVNAGGGPVSSGSPTGVFSQAGCVNGTNLADISENFVFGLAGPTDVKSVADYIGTQASPINFQGSYKLAYYEGNVTYDPASTNVLLQKLNGSGILYVNGNFSVLDGTNSFYDGLIYATGAVTIGISCEIQGSIIGRNGVVVGNTGSLTGDNANLYYGSSQLNKAVQLVGTYREVKTSTKLFQNITNP